MARCAALALFNAAISLAATQTPSTALLVLNKQESTLAIVDPATLQVVAKIPTGPAPHEVAVSADGKLAFTSNYGRDGMGNSISVIDLVTRKERRVDLGMWRGIHGISAWGNQAVFASEGSRVIGHYDPVTNKIERMVTTGQAETHLLVIARDGSKIFASNMDSNNISILERGSTGWNQTLVPVGTSPEGLDLSPDGRELWTATWADGHISVIDVALRKVTQTFGSHTQKANRLRFTPDGKHVLISDEKGGDLVILDALAHNLIARIGLGLSPEGILIEPSGARAFVAVSGDDQVAVVNLKTMKVTARFSTGPNSSPDGMAWAVGR